MPSSGRRPPNSRNFEAGAYTRNQLSTQGGLEQSNAGLDIFRYPSELGTAQYPHFMMFYISKRDSDIGTTERAPDAQQQNFSNQNRFETRPGAALAAVGLLGLGAAEGARKLVDKGSDILNKAGIPSQVTRKVEVGAYVVGGAAGVGLGAVLAANRDRVTLKTAIALYMNNRPSVAYSANWQDTDLGILGGSTSIMSNLKDVVTGREGQGAIAGRMNAAADLAKNLGGAATSFAMKNVNNSIAGEFGDAAGAISAATGQAVNPFKAQLFKNMGFRTFSFDYVFLPKNQSEYQQVQNIIKTFKRYMHPTLGDEKFFMGYPAEFTIEYHYRDSGRNLNLFKISSCALTNMKVEYGGSDFVTFKGTDGAPSEINMSLAFTELEILTEERIMDDY